jgi:hypothetical protein
MYAVENSSLTFDAIADIMYAKQFSFVCPFCSGDDPVRHYHGNNRDRTTHRIESRFSHCISAPRNILIKIDDTIVQMKE